MTAQDDRTDGAAAAENAFRSRPINGWLPAPSELGPAGSPDAAALIRALAVPREGRVYDLDIGRWNLMPLGGSEPPFQVLAYRTPYGLSNDSGFKKFTGEDNAVAWNGDLLIGPLHAGTHIDALSHITTGPENRWYGGAVAERDLGDFGPARSDAAAIPPIIGRGLVIDVAGLHGVRRLEGGYAITVEDIEAVLRPHELEVEPGDAIVLRTGFLADATPDITDPLRPGLGLAAARWLADRGVVVVGTDTPGVEVEPWDGDGHPLPIHRELLIERGVHLLEMVYLEALAEDNVVECLFVCSAPRIRGATASFVRPLAIV